MVVCPGLTQKPRDFGDYASMWGASVCSCLGNLTSAITYYHILSKTNNVESGDFHRSSAPRMIFQCTLSKLKLFSQSFHCRTFRDIVTLCPKSTFLDFVSVFSFFVRIALKIFFFVFSMISWRYSYSSGSPAQQKDSTDLFFPEYRFERISFRMIPNLLRFTQNIYLFLRIYWPPLVTRKFVCNTW